MTIIFSYMSSVLHNQDDQQHIRFNTTFPSTIPTYNPHAAMPYLNTRPPMATLTYSSYPLNLSPFSLEGGGHHWDHIKNY